jgi:hypothetical protein
MFGASAGLRSMDSAFYFSDETGQHSGGRYFLLAGVAFTRYRKWIADELLHAERASGKGKQDWKGTKHLGHRIDYIRRLLQIEAMRGSVFYACYERNEREYWTYTVDALLRALAFFGSGRRNIVRHQGFNYRSREKLRAALVGTGLEVHIESGNKEKRCEIRAADALAGYLGLMKYGSTETSNYYPDVPDWLVNLRP